MPFSPLVAQYSPAIVALSFLMAVCASYVALDLAQRVRTPHAAAARGWWLGGSVAMGTGIWCMHFVGMLAMQLPLGVGYTYGATALSWLASVSVSALALHLASCERLTPVRLGGGALAMGAGICATHYIGMAGLDMVPGIVWSPGWVLLSVAIAVAASALSLQIFSRRQRLVGGAVRQGQMGAALVMGVGICAMHYSAMLAARFSSDAVCRSADQLQGNGLVLLVSAATLLLLGLTLLASATDARRWLRTLQQPSTAQASCTGLQQSGLLDALTALPNRLLLQQRMDRAVEHCAHSANMLAVLFINLDGFKLLNESFGHHFGDAVLRTMSQRLSACARGCDTVARVGSDEFVLLLPDQGDTVMAAQVAQRIMEVLVQPVRSHGHEVRVSCSVGIAMCPQDGGSSQLLTHASAAMAVVKRSGGAAYAFFAPHMHTGVREQMELQADLRQALAHGGLELHYQPKIAARGGAITGVEALARWHHPTRGMVGPAQFIPVVERFGLINALGDWVIAQACQQMAAWQRQGLQLQVAINLSVHPLRQGGLVQRVQDALQQHGIEPSMLVLEVTESVAMEDAGSTLLTFKKLEKLGVQLSIDDFGTGYSSLAYLRRLQVDQVKIDRSFVQDLAGCDDARFIISAVVQLAHALGLSVVAEGVETAEQCDVLVTLGCDELQGYLYARPMPADALQQWVQDRLQAQQQQEHEQAQQGQQGQQPPHHGPVPAQRPCPGLALAPPAPRQVAGLQA